jgi:hypothetical protein
VGGKVPDDRIPSEVFLELRCQQVALQGALEVVRRQPLAVQPGAGRGAGGQALPAPEGVGGRLEFGVAYC